MNEYHASAELRVTHEEVPPVAWRSTRGAHSSRGTSQDSNSYDLHVYNDKFLVSSIETRTYNVLVLFNYVYRLGMEKGFKSTCNCSIIVSVFLLISQTTRKTNDSFQLCALWRWSHCFGVALSRNRIKLSRRIKCALIYSVNRNIFHSSTTYYNVMFRGGFSSACSNRSTYFSPLRYAIRRQLLVNIFHCEPEIDFSCRVQSGTLSGSKFRR